MRKALAPERTACDSCGPPITAAHARHLTQHLPAMGTINALAPRGPQLQRSASLAILQLDLSLHGFFRRLLHSLLLSWQNKKPCAVLRTCSTSQGSRIATGLSCYLVMCGYSRETRR